MVKQSRLATGLRRVAAAGIGVALILGSTAGAVSERSDPEIGVPQQLAEIRDALAAMQAQLDAVQTGLDQSSTAITDLKAQMHRRMDVIDASAGEIYESVNSVEVTTEVCFGTGIKHALDFKGHGEIGVGWPNVLDAKVNAELDEGWNLDMGLGNEVCIQVPLYSVYWPELKISEAEGEHLHSLISNSALGAQLMLPVVGLLSEQALPPPNSVRTVVDTVVYALTSGNPTAAAALLNPATYTPMTPPLIATVLEVAGKAATNAILDPCGTIASHPLLSNVPQSHYDWMCFMEPNQTMEVLNVIDHVLKVGMCVVSVGLYCP